MTSYFEKPERTVQMSIRVPESTKERIRALAREWTELTRSHGEMTRVSENDVVRRLLARATEAAIGELEAKPRKGRK